MPFSGGPFSAGKFSGGPFGQSQSTPPLFSALQAPAYTNRIPPGGWTYARTGNTWDYDAAGVMQQFGAGVLPGGFDPVNHADIGALVEGGATNYIPYSDFNNAAWQAVNASKDQTGAPLDSKGRVMTKLIENSGNSAHYTNNPVAYSCVANNPHCVQWEVRPAGRAVYVAFVWTGNYASKFSAKFNLTTGASAQYQVGGTGAYLSSGIIALGGGLYKIWVSGTLDTTSTTFRPELYMLGSGDAATYQGDGASGVWLSNPMNEHSYTPSSHIDTTGAAAARVRSDLLLPLPQPGFSTDRGTFVCDFVCPIYGTNIYRAIAGIGTTVSTDTVVVYIGNTNIYFYVYIGGVPTANYIITLASIGAASGKRIRVVITWDNGIWYCRFGGPSGSSESIPLQSAFPASDKLALGKFTNSSVDLLSSHMLDTFFLPYAASAQQRQLLAQVR